MGAVAQPRADLPEDQCEAAGGRKQRQQSAKGTYCVRGSGVASVAARRVTGEPVQVGWQAKHAAVSMRQSEITGTERRAVRMRWPVLRKKSQTPQTI